MRKLFFSLLIPLLVFFGGFFAKELFAEEIKEFEAKIYITKEGKINVSERILYD